MDHFNAKALYIIVNAGFSNDIVDIAREAGALGSTIINARGGGASKELFMGMTVDSEKEIIIFLTDEATAGKIVEAVKQKAGYETPAHSICYQITVDRVSGISQLA